MNRGSHRVAAVGVHDPAAGLVVPLEVGDLGLEARVAIEVERLADRTAVLEDLGRVRVLLLRDVAHLFEERKVDVGLDVTHRTRVPVPVPGAAEVAALLDDADVVDASLAQPSAGEQAAEPAADDDDFDLIGERLALDRSDVGILEVVGVVTRHLDVLIVAVRSDALVALQAVLRPQRVGVERARGLSDGWFGVRRQGRSPPAVWLLARHRTARPWVYGPPMVAYGIKTPPQHGTWPEFLAVWKAADDIDLFESAWTMDHFYPLTPPMDGTHLESWTMLAALAALTTRLRLGCMVNGMHYRHPAVTANAAVTVDHVSNGRFSLGLGAGWFEPESNAYGIPLGSLKERFDRFDEGVEVISSLLTNDSTTFAGRYYTLTDARCNPKPLQSHLPIVIGGKGPKRTLRASGALGRPLGCRGRARPGRVEGTQRGLDLALRGDRTGPPADQALGPRHVAGRRRSERARCACGGVRERRRRAGDLLDARALRGAPGRAPRQRLGARLTN